MSAGRSVSRARARCRPSECRDTCILAAKMADAHDAWRRSLAAESLADVLASLPATAPARTRSKLAAIRTGP